MAPVAAVERRYQADNTAFVMPESRPPRRDHDIYSTTSMVEQQVAQVDRLSRILNTRDTPARPFNTFTSDTTSTAFTATPSPQLVRPSSSARALLDRLADPAAPRIENDFAFSIIEDLDGSSVPPFGFNRTADIDAFDNDIDAAFEFEDTHILTDYHSLTTTTTWYVLHYSCTLHSVLTKCRRNYHTDSPTYYKLNTGNQVSYVFVSSHSLSIADLMCAQKLHLLLSHRKRWLPTIKMEIQVARSPPSRSMMDLMYVLSLSNVCIFELTYLVYCRSAIHPLSPPALVYVSSRRPRCLPLSPLLSPTPSSPSSLFARSRSRLPSSAMLLSLIYSPSLFHILHIA